MRHLIHRLTKLPQKSSEIVIVAHTAREEQSYPFDMRRQKSGSYRNNQMVYVNYGRHVLQYIHYSVRFHGNDDNVTAPHHFTVINAGVNAQRLPQKHSVTARSIQLENGKCSLSCQWFRQEAQLSQDRVIRCVVEILPAAAQLYEKLHF